MLQPENNTRDQDERFVVRRPLLVAGSDPPPLLQAVDQPLDPTAFAILFPREPAWTPALATFPLPLLPLVFSFRDQMRDAAPPQRLPTPRIAEPFVQPQPARSLAGAPTFWASIRLPTRYPDAIQHGFQLSTIVPLPFREVGRQGLSAPVAGQMELGGQAAAAAAQRLASNRCRSPFFPARHRSSSGRPGWSRGGLPPHAAARGGWCCLQKHLPNGSRRARRPHPVTPAAAASRDRCVASGPGDRGRCRKGDTDPADPATGHRSGAPTRCHSAPGDAGRRAVLSCRNAPAAAAVRAAATVRRLNLHVPSWSESTQLPSDLPDTP